MPERITEAKIGIATLLILASKPNGEALLSDIKKEMPDFIELTEDDRSRSVTRPNEEMWEQQVRNLISHRTAEGNIFAEGFADYTEGEPLRITSSGRTHLENMNS
jgi:hypothetical protein